MLALAWKGRAFTEKVNSRCFCWFPTTKLSTNMASPYNVTDRYWKLYKGVWNVSANNSKTVGHKDLRSGQIVYILVFCNISFSWLLTVDGFRFIFLCRVYCVMVKTKNRVWKGGSWSRIAAPFSRESRIPQVFHQFPEYRFSFSEKYIKKSNFYKS